jgi:hypothetical protein
MAEPPDVAFQHFMMDMIVELARSGAIPREVLERMTDTDDTRDNSVTMAKGRMAATVLLESSMPVRSRRAGEADFRRRQMRERTAMIERQADGGNEPD